MTSKINNEELAELVQGDEDVEKEFKSAEVLREPSDANRRKIAREMVGFTNRRGGELIFGIDDETHEPEGMSLDDEKSLGTISEIAHYRCEPKVDFTRQIFSSQYDDVEEGEVFVVKVNQRKSIPHAVVEASGRDIKTREYRIRAGDRPRLVSTEELEWLFNQDSPSAEFHGTSWFVYIKTDDGLGLPKLDLPEVQSLLSEFYWKLSGSDKESLMREESKRIKEFVREIAPFAFIRNLCEIHRNSWDIEKSRQGKLEASPSISWGHYHVEHSALQVNRDVPMERLTVADIEVTGLQETLLNELSVDPKGLIKGSFQAPPDVDVAVDLHTRSKKSDEYTRTPTLTISREEKFKFTLQFGRRIGWNQGPPTAHPVNNIRSVEDSLKPLSENMGTVEFEVDFDSEFEFPDSPDQEVDLHQRYGQQLKQILENNWDAYIFLDQRPDHALYRMNYKLDAILRSLGYDQSYF